MGYQLTITTDYGTMMGDTKYETEGEIAANLIKKTRDLRKAIDTGEPPVWESVTLKLEWVD